MVRSGLLVASVISAAALCATTAGAEILIATAGPMTGIYSWAGERYQRGAGMAVADLNAKGGVLGQTIELIVGDDFCDPDQAVALARKLASDGVVFVAGHWCSHASIPAAKVYEEAGVLQIAPGSASAKLTDEGGPNVFRVAAATTSRGRRSPTTSPTTGRARGSRSSTTARPGGWASPTGRGAGCASTA